MSLLSLNWEPSPKYCASMLHMLASIGIVQAAEIHGLSILWTVIILEVVAAVKEFWADVTWLEQDSWAGTTLDFVMYSWGAVLGVISLHWLWAAVLLMVVTFAIAVYIDMHTQGIIR